MDERPPMNTPSSRVDDHRFSQLAQQYLENELNEAEGAELGGLLKANPSYRALLVDMTLQRMALVRILGETGRSPLRAAGASVAYFLLGGPVRAADRWSTAAALLLAYGMFYGAFFSLLWSMRPQIFEFDQRQRQQLAELAADDLNKGVATLAVADDCQWEPGQPATVVGARVTAAQNLRLRSGRVVLRFDGGAEVGLVGPAEARPASAGRIFLTRGQLAAHVPRRASGFTVETSAARFVDLGTDFAVDVDDAGEIKATVTRGAVEVTSLSPTDAHQGAPSSPVRVTAGQSVTVSQSGKRVALTRSTKPPEWVKDLKLSNDTPTSLIAYQTFNGAAGNEGGESIRGFGLDFDVVRPIRIESLGVFDDLGDGVAPDTELAVQIWSRDNRDTPLDNADDQGKQVLAELRFNSASPGVLLAGHRFKPLAAPLDLPTGSYTVVGYGFSAVNRNLNFIYPGTRPRQIETWHGAIAQIGSRHGSGVPGQFPVILPSNNTVRYYFVAGSFKFSPQALAETGAEDADAAPGAKSAFPP